MEWIKRLFKPRFHPKSNPEGHKYTDRHPAYKVSGKNYYMPIRYAFTVDGVDYYAPKLVEDFGPRRMAEYQLSFVEFTLGVTREYLLGYVDKMEEALKIRDGAVDLNAPNVLTWELKLRLQHVQPERLMYRAASAYFFDLEEDLTQYDIAYNNAKIDKWRASGDPADFFFRTPIRQLLRLPHKSEAELRAELATTAAQASIMEQTVLKVLSNSVRNSPESATRSE